MKIIQIRESFRLKRYASIVLNKLQNANVITVHGNAKGKGLAEDIISGFLKDLLEQGITDYDVVTLAGEELNWEGASAVKDTEGVWGLRTKIGERWYNLDKKEVLYLAVKAYKAQAEEALTKY